ncbi:MAG: flippase-like domain-containing protein [Bacilli bacterium]|nr:flippase-like domain-containing protein [Bacilli bacterium]
MKRSKLKKIINILLIVSITSLVLFFSLKDNFTAIVNQILNINIIWLIIAFFLLFIYWILRSLAMHTFVKMVHPEARYFNSLLLMLRTQFVNAITPFATGGQPYQVYYLKKSKIGFANSTVIIVENFIVYQIALVTLGLVALFSNMFMHIFKSNELLSHLIAIGFFMNTIVIIVLFVVSFGKRINRVLINIGITVLTKLRIVKNKQKQLDKWNTTINNFHESASILLKHKRKFVMTILYNFIALIALYLIPLIIVFAFGKYDIINAYEVIITSAYVMLIGSFVPIPGGSGGLEYGFVAFYGNFISGSILSAVMLVWRFITYYFGMIIGAIAFYIKRVKE